MKLQLEIKEILQATREATWLEPGVEWAKFKAQQVEEGPSTLSMNAMAKAIKVLQNLVVNKRDINMQLSLELKEAHKEKGIGPSREATKAMKTRTLNPLMKKDTKAKRVKQCTLQMEAYFESQMINMDVD
jgi:hypothetical protein